MSVAFTKESDSEAVAANLPDRPISPHRNLVTPQGLAAIDAALAEAQAAYGAAQADDGITADRTPMARATRDLRYWSARRASAELIEPHAGDEVAFGNSVTIEREDGRTQTWRIVGEDEAEPARGTLAYVSPVARALAGRKVGDLITAGNSEAEIVAIE